MENQVKALSFDGDMTLWDFQKVMEHSLSIALNELKRRIPGEPAKNLTIHQMSEIRDSVAAELKGQVLILEEIRLRAFQRTVESVGCADSTLADELNSLYLKHRFEDIELYPDVLSTLDTLGRDYAIGLLSNGNGYPERCGLPGCFKFVVFSQNVGFEKPEAEIFLAACKLANCEPNELMHIGDSLESDVAGANNVGSISVWLNRDRDRNNTTIIPDYEINSLEELAKILRAHCELQI